MASSSLPSAIVRTLVEIARWLVPILCLVSVAGRSFGPHHDDPARYRRPASGPDVVRAEPDGSLAIVTPDGNQRGTLRFDACNRDGTLRVHSTRGWVVLSSFDVGPQITEELVALTRNLVLGPAGECEATTRWPSALSSAACASALLALGAWAFRRGKVTLQVRWPHAVPVVIQSSILGYWALYWPGVREHLPSIVLQLLLAFALDAAFSFGRFGSWRIGLGPVPMVLSANLFAWFDPIGSILVVATAVATKTFFRRGDKHVLNPSAAGLLAGGLYVALVPSAGWDGIFHAEAIAPNIVEVVLLLSMFPLIRFNLGLIPLFATVGLLLYGNGPGVTYPGVIITFALFASDPATAPATPAGRLLFGLGVGAGMAFASHLFVSLGAPDDFSKVVPVVFCNLLAPAFDYLGGLWQGRFEQGLLSARWRFAAPAMWVALVLGFHARNKPWQFDGAQHWTYRTPHVVRDPDDVPRCAHNPAFCRPFAFASEVALWTSPSQGP